MNICLCKMLLALVLEIKFSHSCFSFIYVFICVLSTSSPLYMINGVCLLRTLRKITTCLLYGLRKKFVSSLLIRALYGEYDIVNLDRLNTVSFLGRFNGFFVSSLHVSVSSVIDETVLNFASMIFGRNNLRIVCPRNEKNLGVGVLDQGTYCH
jgi:hypothetical protein